MKQGPDMYKPKNIELTIFIVAFTAVHCFANGGDANANKLTNMVQNLTKTVKEIRDKSIKLNPKKDTESVKQLVQEIKDLNVQLQGIKTFVDETIAADPDFKNKLNNEGMPGRIIEGELELYFRYDLDAIGMTLKLGASPADARELKNAIDDLTHTEYEIYDSLENLQGPLIKFNNLAARYQKYAPFIAEGKRYTPQEAHVALHIAAYAIAVEEALALAQYDGGRHLYHVLKTYVNWLPEGTHMAEDVEVIKGHGSIISITDKNDKTLLNWTKEFSEKAKVASTILKQRNKSAVYLDEAIKEFAKIQEILKNGLTLDPETAQIIKMKSRSLLNTDKSKLNAFGFRDVKRQMAPEEAERVKKMEALDLATERKLEEASYLNNFAFIQKKYEAKKSEGAQALSDWIKTLSKEDRKLVDFIEPTEETAPQVSVPSPGQPAASTPASSPGGSAPLGSALGSLKLNLENLEQKLK